MKITEAAWVLESLLNSGVLADIENKALMCIIPVIRTYIKTADIGNHTNAPENTHSFPTELVDYHLDNILRAAGSGLRYYEKWVVPKMREATCSAMTAAASLALEKRT